MSSRIQVIDEVHKQVHWQVDQFRMKDDHLSNNYLLVSKSLVTALKNAR